MIERYKKNNFGKYILFLTLFFVVNTYANSQNLELIQPINKSIYEESYASIVVKIDTKQIDKIKIIQNGNVISTKDFSDEKRDYFCKSVKLHLGKNRFLINGYFNDKLIAKTDSTIFYKTIVNSEFYFVPKEFKKSYFHLDKNEKTCKKCHNMSINGVKKVAFIDVKKSNCYNCHKPIGSKKFVHAPTANWLCTMCHDSKMSKKDKNISKYSTTNPISNRCFICHEQKRKLWWSKKYQHDPMKMGECNKCHNPHGSENEFFIRRPAYELCASCHADKLIVGHIETTFYSGKKHPVRGFDDPSRRGKKLSCVSCHNPHASNHNYLLKRDRESLCLMCHNK